MIQGRFRLALESAEGTVATGTRQARDVVDQLITPFASVSVKSFAQQLEAETSSGTSHGSASITDVLSRTKYLIKEQPHVRLY